MKISVLKLKKNRETHNIKRNKVTLPICAVGIAIVAGLILILGFQMYNGAQSVGSTLGTYTGEIVGLAIGSYNGITQDYWEGREKGIAQGLSAEDTNVTDFFDIIKGSGNLQILVAGVTLDVFHEVGDKYAAIYLLRGEAIFSVNLSEAQIVNRNTVMIPQPEVRLNFDDKEVEKIAEWQVSFFNGSTEDGYNAYINSIDQSKKNAAASIENYDELMIQAQEAAKRQVQILVMNMTGESVDVLFFPGGEG